MVEPHVDGYWNVEKNTKMLTINILHALVFYEHAMLFPLELLFQHLHQYVHFRDFLISSVHAGLPVEILAWGGETHWGTRV